MARRHRYRCFGSDCCWFACELCLPIAIVILGLSFFGGVVEKNENFSTVASIQKHSTASFAFWWQSSSSFTLHKPGKMCANNNNNNNNRKKQKTRKMLGKKIENALWHAIECRWFVFTPNIFLNFICNVCARNCLAPNVGKCFLLFS